MMKRFSIFVGLLLLCWVLPGYGQGYKYLNNIAPEATVEAEGADIPVTNVNDENFTTRWNAKNDDAERLTEHKPHGLSNFWHKS